MSDSVIIAVVMVEESRLTDYWAHGGDDHLRKGQQRGFHSRLIIAPSGSSGSAAEKREEQRGARKGEGFDGALCASGPGISCLSLKGIMQKKSC